MNYYEILEVSPKASQEVIRAAYKSLMQRYHPDKHPGDVEITKRVLLIGHAYDVLSDPFKRETYDIALNQLSKIELSATHNKSSTIQPIPSIKKVKSAWFYPGIAMMVVIVFGIIPWIMDSSSLNPPNKEQPEAKYSDVLQEIHQEYDKKIASDKADLANRTTLGFALNLSIPMAPHIYKGIAGHDLFIPKLGIIVGKSDSKNVINYINNNKELII